MLREQLRRSRRSGVSGKTPAANDATVLIVGHGDARTDDISFSGTVQIDGRVEGDIRCKRLVVTAHGLIDGAITARTAHIEGTVNGPIDAIKISLAPTATVKGNLTYESLNISTGASMSGFCRDRGHTRVRPFDWALADGAPSLPFNLAKAACRKSSINISPLPPLKLVGSRSTLSMKAVWEHYQQSVPTTRQ